MSPIFICYRREDSEDIAGRIYDRLQNHFRRENVFLDTNSIMGGNYFSERIDKAIRQCQVFLAVIGRDWSDVQDGKIDYARLEIEAALRHKVYIIPVLVRKVQQEFWKDLPACLEPLKLRNTVRIHSDQNFDRDVNNLIRNIEFYFYMPLPQLSSFFFEIITLNDQNKIEREPGKKQHFIEHLGNDVVLDMVEIQGGTFMMGSQNRDIDPQSRDNEYPQHRVTVPRFFMSRYTITQSQWFQVASLRPVDQALQSNPSRFPGDDRPVEQVSWYDAVEFCQRLSQNTKRRYRLPSEAEWEYACRAGLESTFSFGSKITTGVANYDGSPYVDGLAGERRRQTIHVKELGANPFGLSQMHGNVDEWCFDHWHDNYKGAPGDGSAWLTSDENEKRVLRGGSWVCAPWWCRSVSRLCDFPGNNLNNIGFRVALSQPTVNPS